MNRHFLSVLAVACCSAGVVEAGCPTNCQPVCQPVCQPACQPACQPVCRTACQPASQPIETTASRPFYFRYSCQSCRPIGFGGLQICYGCVPDWGANGPWRCVNCANGYCAGCWRIGNSVSQAMPASCQPVSSQACCAIKARCGCPADTFCAGPCSRLCNIRGCFDVCGGPCLPYR